MVGWTLQVLSTVGQVFEALGVFEGYHPKTLGSLVTQDSEPAGSALMEHRPLMGSSPSRSSPGRSRGKDKSKVPCRFFKSGKLQT